MADAYAYEPLDLAKDSIRLLRLYKGYPLDEIRCELHQSLLSDFEGIPYEALSYTWGGEVTNVSPRVLIGDHQVPVTHNLFEALSSLRLRDEDRLLWVDALCIDQNDHHEKGHQVGQMASVYRNAERVLVWLGPSTQAVDELMDMMTLWDKEFKMLPQKLQILEKAWSSKVYPLGHIDDASYRDHVATFSRLVERDWFKRVWIIQEVANARAAFIMCGTKIVSSRMFSIMHLLMHIQPHPHTRAVMEVMPGPLRKQSWWTTDRRLLTLLIKFNGSKATQEHDRIYALLGIASDAPGFPIDYGCPFQHLVNQTISLISLGDAGQTQLFDNAPPLLFDALFQDIHHASQLSTRVLQLASNQPEEALIKELLNTPASRAILFDAFSNDASSNASSNTPKKKQRYIYSQSLFNLYTGAVLPDYLDLVGIYQYAAGRKHYSVCKDISKMAEFKPTDAELSGFLEKAPFSLVQDLVKRRINLTEIYKHALKCCNYSLCNEISDMPEFKATNGFLMQLFWGSLEIPELELQKIAKQRCHEDAQELYEVLRMLIEGSERPVNRHNERIFVDEVVRFGIILHGKAWARAAVKDSHARVLLVFLLKSLKAANVEGLPSFATDILRILRYRKEFSRVQIDTLKTLLDCGADIEVYTPPWGTPLRQAIGKSCHWLVRILVERGANLSSRDERGRTPLHYAESIDDKHSTSPPEYRPAVIAILLLHGADEWAEDRDGRTPWQLNQENPGGMKRRDKGQIQKLISAVAPSKQHLFEKLLEGR